MNDSGVSTAAFIEKETNSKHTLSPRTPPEQIIGLCANLQQGDLELLLNLTHCCGIA